MPVIEIIEACGTRLRQSGMDNVPDSKAARTVTVYLFSRIENGREIAPKQMSGTLEAIARLPGPPTPIMESAREVSEDSLEYGGFAFGGSWALRTNAAEHEQDFENSRRQAMVGGDADI